MENLVAVKMLFLATLTSYVAVNFLLRNAGYMQTEYDKLLTTNSCRSAYERPAYGRFRFSNQQVLCPFKRTDYGAPGTGNSSPYPTCYLLGVLNQGSGNKGSSTCASL